MSPFRDFMHAKCYHDKSCSDAQIYDHYAFKVMGRAARELFRCQLPLEHLVHRLTKEVPFYRRFCSYDRAYT